MQRRRQRHIQQCHMMDDTDTHRQFDTLFSKYKGSSYRVFISHAGPQNLTFADGLWQALRRNGVNAFTDQHDLHQDDAAAQKMEAAKRMQMSWCLSSHWTSCGAATAWRSRVGFWMSGSDGSSRSRSQQPS